MESSVRRSPGQGAMTPSSVPLLPPSPSVLNLSTSGNSSILMTDKADPLPRLSVVAAAPSSPATAAVDGPVSLPSPATSSMGSPGLAIPSSTLAASVGTPHRPSTSQNNNNNNAFLVAAFQHSVVGNNSAVRPLTPAALQQRTLDRLTPAKFSTVVDDEDDEDGSSDDDVSDRDWKGASDRSSPSQHGGSSNTAAGRKSLASSKILGKLTNPNATAAAWRSYRPKVDVDALTNQLMEAADNLIANPQLMLFNESANNNNRKSVAASAKPFVSLGESPSLLAAASTSDVPSCDSDSQASFSQRRQHKRNKSKSKQKPEHSEASTSGTEEDDTDSDSLATTESSLTSSNVASPLLQSQFSGMQENVPPSGGGVSNRKSTTTILGNSLATMRTVSELSSAVTDDTQAIAVDVRAIRRQHQREHRAQFEAAWIEQEEFLAQSIKRQGSEARLRRQASRKLGLQRASVQRDALIERARRSSGGGVKFLDENATTDGSDSSSPQRLSIVQATLQQNPIAQVVQEVIKEQQHAQQKTLINARKRRNAMLLQGLRAGDFDADFVASVQELNSVDDAIAVMEAYYEAGHHLAHRQKVEAMRAARAARAMAVAAAASRRAARRDSAGGEFGAFESSSAFGGEDGATWNEHEGYMAGLPRLDSRRLSQQTRRRSSATSSGPSGFLSADPNERRTALLKLLEKRRAAEAEMLSKEKKTLSRRTLSGFKVLQRKGTTLTKDGKKTRSSSTKEKVGDEGGAAEEDELDHGPVPALAVFSRRWQRRTAPSHLLKTVAAAGGELAAYAMQRASVAGASTTASEEDDLLNYYPADSYLLFFRSIHKVTAQEMLSTSTKLLGNVSFFYPFVTAEKDNEGGDGDDEEGGGGLTREKAMQLIDEAIAENKPEMEMLDATIAMLDLPHVPLTTNAQREEVVRQHRAEQLRDAVNERRDKIQKWILPKFTRFLAKRLRDGEKEHSRGTEGIIFFSSISRFGSSAFFFDAVSAPGQGKSPMKRIYVSRNALLTAGDMAEDGALINDAKKSTPTTTSATPVAETPSLLPPAGSSPSTSNLPLVAADGGAPSSSLDPGRPTTGRSPSAVPLMPPVSAVKPPKKFYIVAAPPKESDRSKMTAEERRLADLEAYKRRVTNHRWCVLHYPEAKEKEYDAQLELAARQGQPQQEADVVPNDGMISNQVDGSTALAEEIQWSSVLPPKPVTVSPREKASKSHHNSSSSSAPSINPSSNNNNNSAKKMNVSPPPPLSLSRESGRRIGTADSTLQTPLSTTSSSPVATPAYQVSSTRVAHRALSKKVPSFPENVFRPPSPVSHGWPDLQPLPTDVNNSMDSKPSPTGTVASAAVAAQSLSSPMRKVGNRSAGSDVASWTDGAMMMSNVRVTQYAMPPTKMLSRSVKKPSTAPLSGVPQSARTVPLLQNATVVSMPSASSDSMKMLMKGSCSMDTSCSTVTTTTTTLGTTPLPPALAAATTDHTTNNNTTTTLRPGTTGTATVSHVGGERGGQGRWAAGSGAAALLSWDLMWATTFGGGNAHDGLSSVLPSFSENHSSSAAAAGACQGIDLADTAVSSRKLVSREKSEFLKKIPKPRTPREHEKSPRKQR